MAKETYPYLTKERTYADFIRNDQLELAMQNDFLVDPDDIAAKFSFTDYWSGHAYTADQGTVVIGQGIIVGVKDNPGNVVPTLSDSSGSIKPLGFTTTQSAFRDRKWTNVLIADSETAAVNPIGMLRKHAFKNIDCAHSGDNPTVYVGPCVVEVPYVIRSIAADMQLGCITDAYENQAAVSLMPGDYVTVGGIADAGTATDLSGKMRGMLASDDERLKIGQVLEIKRNISMRGWLEKVSLGLYDYKRPLAFWTSPTTAECPPWADDAGLKWPGYNIPQQGRGLGGGLTDGEYYGVPVAYVHTVTAADVIAAGGALQFNITRYEDNGETLGYVTAGACVVTNGGEGGGAGGSATVTAAGAITWLTAGTALEGDVLTITATAYGQIPGVPANFTIQTDQDDISTQAAAVGLAVVRLHF